MDQLSGIRIRGCAFFFITDIRQTIHYNETYNRFTVKTHLGMFVCITSKFQLEVITSYIFKCTSFIMDNYRQAIHSVMCSILEIMERHDKFGNPVFIFFFYCKASMSLVAFARNCSLFQHGSRFVRSPFILSISIKLIPLYPKRFLTEGSQIILICFNVTDVKKNRLNKFQLFRMMQLQREKVWQHDYLKLFQQRSKRLCIISRRQYGREDRSR